jgi:type IV pilus biogenesis protein CpaD/CtpE
MSLGDIPLRRILLAFLALGTLAACTEAQTYGALAVEKRRQMNDMQARATMAATCDISLGAYFRELSETERAYAGLVCGGAFPRVEPAALPQGS